MHCSNDLQSVVLSPTQRETLVYHLLNSMTGRPSYWFRRFKGCAPLKTYHCRDIIDCYFKEGEKAIDSVDDDVKSILGEVLLSLAIKIIVEWLIKLLRTEKHGG